MSETKAEQRLVGMADTAPAETADALTHWHLCDVHQPERWESDGSCPICEGHQLRARCASLEAALRMVEWTDPGDGSRWCFACHQEREYGHAPTCAVGAALSTPGGTP